MKYIATQIWGDLHCYGMDYGYRKAEVGSIQLGDFCLLDDGYKNIDFKKLSKRYSKQYGPRFFVEGNHDYFPALNCNADEPYCVNDQGTLFHIPRGYVSGRTMFIGGADSIDKDDRTTGHDHFVEESISQRQFEKIMEVDRFGVEVILSHECPQFVRREFFGITNREPTSLAFDSIFEYFKPKMWIFAHHHRSVKDTVKGCQFICIPTGSWIHVDLPLGSLFENVWK